MIKKMMFFILLVLSVSLFANDGPRWGFIGTFGFPFYTGSGYNSFLDDYKLDNSVDEVSQNPAIGFTLGPTLEYRFNSFFSIEGEVLLAGSGGAYVVVDNGVRSSRIISEINLEFPFLMKFRTETSKGRFLYFMTGPQLSGLISEATYTQDGHSFEKSQQGLSAFNTLGFGLLSAIGWQAPMKNLDILVEIRYLREFTNSLKGMGSNYQNVISIGTGVKFGKRGDQS